MTTNFDPAKHKIVAVVVDPNSAENGMHFHLSLPDLVREASELPQIDWSPIERRVNAVEVRQAQIEAAVKSFREDRSQATALVPVAIPADHVARIEALEDHAVASNELSDALSNLAILVRRQDDEMKRVKTEQAHTREVLATTLPALAKLASRR